MSRMGLGLAFLFWALAAVHLAIASEEPKTVRQVSLYADVKARSVGDLLTVAIIERASASNTSRLSTRRNSRFENNADEGTGLFDFFPEFGLSAQFGQDHEGSGQLTREGRLTARMAAEVVEVRPNGDLVITGERVVEMNEEKETLTLKGVVRPEDIGPGNLVYSTNIAQAEIAYKGKGIVTKGSRPNIFVRILSWIF